MQIEQLMEKEKQAQYQLISLFYQSTNEMTLKEATRNTNLSKQTVIKYIESLNSTLQLSQFNTRLIVKDDRLLWEMPDDLSWQHLVFMFLKDDIKYQILYHLFKHRQFNITQLAQTLLISEATLNRHLSGLNKLLAEFHIGISQGHQVGEELQWRYFYYELFSQSLPLKERQHFVRQLDVTPYVRLIERLCATTLSQDKIDQLMLWLSISQQRLMMLNKDNTVLLREKAKSYLENVFYSRLEKAVSHYFSRFAIEFDTSEVMALFAFLTSQDLLPIATMKYILGFGGPVSEKVTEALWLLRKGQMIEEGTIEEVIYGLGQLFSKAYFFQGKILSQPTDDYLTEAIVAKENRDTLALLLNHVLVLADAREFHHSDLGESCKRELRELLIFSHEKRQKILNVGIDTGDNPVRQAILILKLRHCLDNNQYVHFKAFDEKTRFDYIISELDRQYQPLIPIYRMKQNGSPRDLAIIGHHLKTLLREKSGL
ncbi:helix-turn-helix domain-containing protein [Streptococcus sp. CSL10205-OR2]|uniref:helix-turn-helix domain-containing protein n=1 Tax=Streptococcus sp. CSL10205-OR2 TaxID=2980558 RepID=UPI0021D83445|nr:helix-turn-helix domain-containing protein [Streptococcus sp. CSL10205-OR2]MCU9533569.1 helix-turn-helix domain-containing protein [Streptococcus sp. CSL10205-OR2]